MKIWHSGLHNIDAQVEHGQSAPIQHIQQHLPYGSGVFSNRSPRCEASKTAKENRKSCTRLWRFSATERVVIIILPFDNERVRVTADQHERDERDVKRWYELRRRAGVRDRALSRRARSHFCVLLFRLIRPANMTFQELKL